MICSHCGAQVAADAVYCSACGHKAGNDAAPVVNLDKPSSVVPDPSERARDAIPDGVKGWSWGAFFLNGIWAIGNRTWIGLLAFIPYIGWIMAFWLGFKGREMAWKNKKWDSLEHFNRVQRRWSQWGLATMVAAMVLGVWVGLSMPETLVDRQPPAPSQAPAETNREPVTARGLIDSNADNLPDSLSTVAGLLERRTGADGGRAVALGGKVLFSGDDAPWQFPLRSFALADGKEAILMASSGGRGNSCETLFFFLLADTSGVKPTPMFGTCAPKGKFVQRGDTIEIVLPELNGASTTFLKDGMVVEDGQVVTMTGMNDPSR